MAQRKRAGLITPRTYDRNVLPVSITIQLLYRSSTRLHMDTLNRHGAAAARAAHNREDTRSKRVAGIHHITSHRCIKALEQPLNRHGAAEARGAHNSEVTRSKRVAGMITIQLLYRSSTRPHMDTLNRHGAAEARGAHNSEDIRSKRIAGIHYNSVALQKQHPSTHGHFKPAWRSGSARGS